VDEPSQKLPAKFVENLLKEDDFVTVQYMNYSVAETTDQTAEDGSILEEGGKKVNFTIVAAIQGRESAYEAPAESAE